MSKKLLWLTTLLVILALSLVACGSTTTTETEAPAEEAAEPTEEAAAPVEEEAAPAEGANQLEFFSWWTAGGEADGLNAMYEVFGASREHGVSLCNAAPARWDRIEAWVRGVLRVPLRGAGAGGRDGGRGPVAAPGGRN